MRSLMQDRLESLEHLPLSKGLRQEKLTLEPGIVSGKNSHQNQDDNHRVSFNLSTAIATGLLTFEIRGKLLMIVNTTIVQKGLDCA